MYVPKRESKYWNTADSFNKLAASMPGDEFGFLHDYFDDPTQDKEIEKKEKLSPLITAGGGLAGGLAGHGISTLSKQFLHEDLGLAPEIVGVLGGAYLGDLYQRNRVEEKKKVDEEE